MTYVFVYGTLKQRHGNHRVLGDAVFIGEGATVSDEFTMFNGGFPFVSTGFDEHRGRVFGELYETDDEGILRNLDRLEGVPYLYIKREVDVTTVDGQQHRATLYVASEESNRRMSHREQIVPRGGTKILEWN